MNGADCKCVVEMAGGRAVRAVYSSALQSPHATNRTNRDHDFAKYFLKFSRLKEFSPFGSDRFRTLLLNLIPVRSIGIK